MVYKKYAYHTHINTQILNSQMQSWFLLQATEPWWLSQEIEMKQNLLATTEGKLRLRVLQGH